jgi:hypothetical protein
MWKKLLCAIVIVIQTMESKLKIDFLKPLLEGVTKFTKIH